MDIDYADDSREDSVVYTNGIVPDSIFTDGCQWQIAGSDGTLTDVVSGMAIENDVTLIEKSVEPNDQNQLQSKRLNLHQSRHRSQRLNLHQSRHQNQFRRWIGLHNSSWTWRICDKTIVRDWASEWF